MPQNALRPVPTTRFLTLDEVRTALDCSLATVRRRIAGGELPAVRHGRVLRVLESDLQAFTEAARKWR
jgi:excisionase family DNA binding protein